MKCSHVLLISITTLVCGCVLGWWLGPKFEDAPNVPMPEYGGCVDYGFNADITWHPETEIKASDLSLYKTTWNWTFHNRTDAPIQFSIPQQKIHLDRSIYSSQFIDLPEPMLIELPVIIKPNEKLILTTKAAGTGWNKAKNREYGFKVVAKINDTYHILGCAVNIHKAPSQ